MKSIRFRLSPAERELILKYGYPFDEFEAKLRACADNRKSVSFSLDSFMFERLLGDLARSANDTTDSALNDQLNELCDFLENAARKHGLTTY